MDSVLNTGFRLSTSPGAVFPRWKTCSARRAGETAAMNAGATTDRVIQSVLTTQNDTPSPADGARQVRALPGLSLTKHIKL